MSEMNENNLDRPAVPTLVDGQFRLLSRLGAGGMGEVHLAEQVGLNRKVVLKVVHAHLIAERDEIGERFAREARALARINHPNVVQLYAYGTLPDGRPYFAMEFVDGRTLGDELQRGPLLEHRALTIAASIAHALQAAHEAGIVHRDLKPANVMLTVRHRDPDFVKVLDFGIAKLSDQADKKLTQTGAFCGTPQYVAPEQVAGQAITAATDIYALGAMLFEMLTGRAVFESATPFGVVQMHLSAPPLSPSTVSPRISRAADAIVLRCLEKVPANRFPSAEALADALQAALASLPGPVTPGAGSTVALPPTKRLEQPDEPLPGVGGTRLFSKADHPRSSGPVFPRPVTLDDQPVPSVSKRSKRSWIWGLLALAAAALLAARLVGLRWIVTLSADGSQNAPGTANAPSSSEATARKTAPGEHKTTAAVPSSLTAGGSAVSGSAAGVPATSRSTTVDDAIVTCLNRHSQNAWFSYAMYLRWVTPEEGPTGHEQAVSGVSKTDGTAGCAQAVASLPAGDAESSGLKRWLASAEKLTELVTRADTYYQAKRWKDDQMAQGKAMHRPLMDAYRAFASADQAVRARWDADRDARSRQPPGANRDPSGLVEALAPLRQVARELVRIADIPWRRLGTVDPSRFDAAVARLEREAATFTASDMTAAHKTGRVSERAADLVMKAHDLRRRLGRDPKWRAADRERLDHLIAQMMVEGAPAQTVRSYNAFVEAVNDLHPQDGLDLMQVHLEPPVTN